MNIIESTPKVERTFDVTLNENEAMAMLLIMGNLGHASIDKLLDRVSLSFDEKCRLRNLLDNQWYDQLAELFDDPYGDMSVSFEQTEDRLLREIGVRK